MLDRGGNEMWLDRAQTIITLKQNHAQITKLLQITQITTSSSFTFRTTNMCYHFVWSLDYPEQNVYLRTT